MGSVASHTLRLLRVLAVGLLAGLCASGTCSVAISTEHCSGDCGCDDCSSCDGCDCRCGSSCCGDLDAADSAPPPHASQAFVLDEEGAVHPVWALVDPAEGVELVPPR